MELIIAQTAGFCMGVDMALRKLDHALENKKPSGSIFTLGPIIHNPQVLERYQTLGVTQANADTHLHTGDTVVIRAHGIPRQIQEQYKSKGLFLVDATCPKVKKAQILIQKQAAVGKQLLLFGERNHPEVQGLISYAKNSVLFESLEELRNLHLDQHQNLFLAAQTTQDKGLFNTISDYLRNQISPNILILDTICTATKDRQDEIQHIAKKVQAMVVVGGRESGNTRRLAQIAAETGIHSIHVEIAAELPLAQLQGYQRIGLTAGASTPDWIIEDVALTLRRLDARN